MTTPQLTTQQKEAIGQKMLDAFAASGFESRAKYAVSIGITSTDFTNIERQNWKKNDRLLSVQKWLRLAHKVGYEFTSIQSWRTAETATYVRITRQLDICRNEGLSAIYCDEAGWGKSHAAKAYCATHPNAFYINGGSFPRKVAFIRALSTAVGINPDKSKVEDALQDVITYLKAIHKPVIVIDEAGDLHNGTYALLKRIYNELEFVCGLYLIGARDLKKRIDSAIRNRTSGFEEVFSRLGGKYSSAIPEGLKEGKEFKLREARLVAEANGLTNTEKLNKILSRDFDLRAVRREVRKTRAAA